MAKATSQELIAFKLNQNQAFHALQVSGATDDKPYIMANPKKQYINYI